MTREEAIKHIKAMCQMLLGADNKPISDTYYALEMALENLSAEPCSDAISRQSALESFHYLPMYSVETKDGQHKSAWVCDGVWAKISLLPSVHAEPRTGHWIEHPEIETSVSEYIMFYECSECGDKQCFCKSNIHRKHFCNNCGAKMVESQESEDFNV